ncbi:MAG: DEAD/DEAH box helicase [Myxococcota bacterium]
MNNFTDLGFDSAILRALDEAGYETPTPIQAAAIPPLLEGRDVLGCAQTGTGKTAAFLLPTLQKLASNAAPGRPRIRALVLTPTRELAAQIGDNFTAYAKHLSLRHRVIFGGVGQNPQVADLRRGVDVVVATPGRLLDLHQQGHMNLGDVEFFVLDEADRMLDMGFIHDIRRVLKLLPERRQNLLFSATMPPDIIKLASGFLNDPIKVEVDQQSSTVDAIEQRVMFVERPNKRRLLTSLLQDPDIERAIVFTRTKHGANRVVRHLDKAGVASAAIHGNKSQNARTRALDGFREGTLRVLVATDIASRGIDVDDVSHVFNFDLPNISESYVHRIGRTGRAGRTGIAVAFCDETETGYLVDIERLTGTPLERVLDHPWHFADAIPRPGQRPSKKKASSHRSRRPRSRRPRRDRRER